MAHTRTIILTRRATTQTQQQRNTNKTEDNIDKTRSIQTKRKFSKTMPNTNTRTNNYPKTRTINLTRLSATQGTTHNGI